MKVKKWDPMKPCVLSSGKTTETGVFQLKDLPEKAQKI